MLGDNRAKKGSGIVIDDLGILRGKVSLVAGVDAGSTETRVALADAKDAAIFSADNRVVESLNALLKTYSIPSTYANIDDARELPPVSSNLEDNYDSNVILIKNGAEKPMLSKHRVLRGRKIQDATGLVSRYLDSSTNKTDNIIFYMNIIDALGYAILQKYNGKVPTEVDAHLVLSVRPKELTTFCKKKMMENLVGEFVFRWGKITVAINITTLEFTTEPEAQITGTTTVCDLKAATDFEHADLYKARADKLADSETYIHIEGGGSSIGVEVLKHGEIIDSCSSTFALGGNYLAQVFIDRVRDTMGRTITADAANKAIYTCLLRSGKETLDVSHLVSECKNQVGLNILERLRHEVIDLTSNIMMEDVEFITLGGRLLRKDDAGVSIADYFEQYVHQLSPNTDIIVLDDNYIPQGNLVIGLNTATLLDEDAAPRGIPGPVTPSFPAESAGEGDDALL